VRSTSAIPRSSSWVEQLASRRRVRTASR
jgi:hypothetical protein